MAQKEEKVKKKPVETRYHVSELACVARSRFRTLPEVVYTALSAKGKEKATIQEAEEIIRDFLGRKVI